MLTLRLLTPRLILGAANGGDGADRTNIGYSANNSFGGSRSIRSVTIASTPQLLRRLAVSGSFTVQQTSQ